MNEYTLRELRMLRGRVQAVQQRAAQEQGPAAEALRTELAKAQHALTDAQQHAEQLKTTK